MEDSQLYGRKHQAIVATACAQLPSCQGTYRVHLGYRVTMRILSVLASLTARSS
jgi:hypothetical protein